MCFSGKNRIWRYYICYNLKTILKEYIDIANIITSVGIEEDGKIIIRPGEFDEITPVIFDNGEVSDKLFLVKDGDEEGDNLLLITKEESEGYLLYGTIHRLGTINKNCIAVSDYDERHGEKMGSH